MGTFALLYTKINVKFNRFLFLTSLESPLNKGGSADVWKYRWLRTNGRNKKNENRFSIIIIYTIDIRIK